MLWRYLELAMWAAFMALIMTTAAPAATMKCKGFAFIVAQLECETQEPPVSAAGFCNVMNRQGGAFRWSKDDTNRTKNRADNINAVGKKLCGWGKK